MEIIYCSDGNRRFAEIAITAGFLYGAQLPNTVYFPPYMADQDWKKPNRAAYMAALALHRPAIATVMDLEQEEQLPEVLSWSEEAAQYVSTIIIIPKIFGIIRRLPHRIGGSDVRLGYSVPTKFGGTDVPVWEFADRPVHLLGGSPQAQMKLCQYMTVASADGNMMQKMAMGFGAFWDGSKTTRRGYWPTIQDFDGKRGGDGGNSADAPYEAFRRSCENIMSAWSVTGVTKRG